MKKYKLLKDGKLMPSLIPGKYAGNTTHKIFGRLDCKSGERLMHKENRVFFASWDDAIKAGYEPCEKCEPRSSDWYEEHRILKMDLLAQPHFSLKEIYPPKNLRRLRPRWLVSLEWEVEIGDEISPNKIELTKPLIEPTARDLAILLGEKCNLPVLEHDWVGSITSIGIPVERGDDELAKMRDKKALEELQKNKKLIEFDLKIQ